MKRLISLFWTLLPSLLLSAQEVKRIAPVPDRPVRRLVVADMETRVPIRKAVVTSKDGYRDSSNYRGIVAVPKDFDTLRIYKAGYLPAKLTMKEVGDTTFLIPSGASLREVTVWGKDGSNRANENMAEGLKRAIGEGKAAAPKGIASFDFANMIDRRGRRDRKHLKKVKESFRKMDQLDEDPVINAYKKDQENKRLAHERQLAEDERDAAIRQRMAEQLGTAATDSLSGQMPDSLSGRADSLAVQADTLSLQTVGGIRHNARPQSVVSSQPSTSGIVARPQAAGKAADNVRRQPEKTTPDVPKLVRKEECK